MDEMLVEGVPQHGEGLVIYSVWSFALNIGIKIITAVC